MAEGRERSEWRRTAQLAQILANASRDGEKHPEPFKPADFSPYPDEYETSETGGVRDLRAAFMGW